MLPPPAKATGMSFSRTISLSAPQSLAGRAAFSCLCLLVFATYLAAQEITSFYIREYRVEGARRLKNLEVEEAVYPFLGPARTPDDVEQARVALEKVYHAKGYQTVSVVVPQQDPRRGIIRLEVVESKVGRLRVNSALFFLPSVIKRDAPAMAEGKVPDMNRVGKEIVALNITGGNGPDMGLNPGGGNGNGGSRRGGLGGTNKFARYSISAAPGGGFLQGAAFNAFQGGVQQQGGALAFGTFGPAGQVEFALDLYRILPRITAAG